MSLFGAACLFAVLLAPVPVNILEMACKNPALWAFGYMRSSMRMAVRLAYLHRNEELRKALPSKLLSLLMAVTDFRSDDSILCHGAVYNGHKYDWDWLTNGMGKAWLGDDGLYLNGPFDETDGRLVGSVVKAVKILVDLVFHDVVQAWDVRGHRPFEEHQSAGVTYWGAYGEHGEGGG
jgi:hypothetical protein